MREKAVAFGPGKSLVGILTPPEEAVGGSASARPAVLFLNAGILHRVGPNRLHVRLARMLAAAGHPCLRFDFAGTGDSPAAAGGESFDECARAATRAAMDYLTSTTGAERFAIVGLCSGADIGLAVALDEPRVVGGLLVNGRYLDPVGDRTLFREAEQRTLNRYYRSRALDPASWKRLVSGKSNLGALAGNLRSTVARKLGVSGATAKSTAPIERPKGDGPQGGDPDAEVEAVARSAEPPFARFLDRSIELLLIASEGSISWDLERFVVGPGAERLRAAGKLRMARLQRADHVFTLRWSQDWLCEQATAWAARLPAD